MVCAVTVVCGLVPDFAVNVATSLPPSVLSAGANSNVTVAALPAASDAGGEVVNV